ncbi:MAG: cytochrome oxidase subunit III [Flavobacteriales bacterium]|nr:cytochrome oxidase subunit III [Flavobacteriales bacterium]
MDKKSKALKMMLWFGLGSLIMTFAGLTSAFIVSKNRVDWINDFPIPQAFYLSLTVIIISSLSLFFSKKYLIENKNLSNLFLVITIILGLSFILLQFIGFSQIINEGFHFTGPTSSINSSFIFLIAFVHIIHVLVALFFLIYVLIRNFYVQINDQNSLGFELASIFWHFVDILWIYLFIFLVFFG